MENRVVDVETGETAIDRSWLYSVDPEIEVPSIGDNDDGAILKLLLFFAGMAAGIILGWATT